MSKSILDFPLEAADTIAQQYVEALHPYCTRIEVAGSIRRRKEIIHDIEIVAVPFVEDQLDMFGAVTASRSLLDIEANRLALGWGAILKKNGPKYKQFGLAEGLGLDLFLVTPPAQWGVQLAIRTGPWQFSKQLVTAKKYHTEEGRPGFLPSWAQVQDGHVQHRETHEVFPMPEESDLFTFCGLNYINPKERM